MEDMLDRPLRELIPQLQERFCARTRYCGVPTLKSPFDVWTYQELICYTKPDFVVEIGTFYGGSTLAIADILEDAGLPGIVVSVDRDHSHVHELVRKHKRVRLVQSDAVTAYATVKDIVGEGNSMVIEDSLHSYDNTLGILRTYSPLVRLGCYLVVEDTICGHGLEHTSTGAYEAVETFVSEDDRFQVDRDAEMFCLTWNPNGFLRRKK
jgi:cephalosporin hydroxylase